MLKQDEEASKVAREKSIPFFVHRDMCSCICDVGIRSKNSQTIHQPALASHAQTDPKRGIPGKVRLTKARAS